jgi:prepilin-type N-terminal cleavage/methylation domain-containing protein
MSNGSEGGFTLLEMVGVLALIAMMAAFLLPFISRNISRFRLRAYALQTATLLKADRNAGWTSPRWWTTSRPVIGRGNLRAVHSHDT